MRLLNPFGLLGLAVIPIIIGLHLHLERNRRVIVSSMFLWSFLDVRFEGKRPKFVRLSLLLLLDILIGILLSGALARPVILVPRERAQNYDQVILIDNSTSMLAVEDGIERFSLAVTMAGSLLQESSSDTDTLIVAIGGEVEIVGSTREMERSDLAKKLVALSAGGIGIQLREGLSLAEAFADLERPVKVFIMTDAAYSIPQFADFSLPVEWVFLGFETNNQALVNASIQSVGSAGAELYFQLVNFAGMDVTREMVLTINGIDIQQATLTVPANSLMTQTVELGSGVENIEIALSGTDSLPADDIVRLSSLNQRSIRVRLVTDMPYPINRAIAANDNVDLDVILPEDYSVAGNYELTIFRGYIPDVLPQGEVLIFDLPGNSFIPIEGAEAINGDLSVGNHEVLSGIDFNAVIWGNNQKVNLSIAREEDGYSQTVLVKDGENPLFVLLEKDEQEIFLFLPDLQSGYFTGNPAFPVLVSNMIEYAGKFNLKQSYILGETLELSEFAGLIPANILYPDAEESREILGTQFVELDRVGIYTIEFLDIFGRTSSYSFGVNAGSVMESNISPNNWRSTISSVQVDEAVEAQIVEFDLSPILLGMAILLLVVEAWRSWR